MPASGWGSLWESSSFVPWFMLYVFRDVFGAVPEWAWINGFMRKSSSRYNAPKMKFLVSLSSWDNFFVTIPSISSQIWVMEFSYDLGTFEFCAKLFRGCFSRFSLFNVANFFWFLRVAVFCAKIEYQWNLIDCFYWREIKVLFYSFLIMEKSKLGNIVSTTESLSKFLFL